VEVKVSVVDISKRCLADVSMHVGQIADELEDEKVRSCVVLIEHAEGPMDIWLLGPGADPLRAIGLMHRAQARLAEPGNRIAAAPHDVS
jgi:hypothetical protein